MDGDDIVTTSDGVQLAVRSHGGTGPAVLLLHGLGEHLLSMARLAGSLTNELRVVSADLRWSGQSGGSPAFDWDVLVDDVDDVAAALALHQPLVVGHSLGGIVATRYGAAHPECSGIVNIDGWGFGDPDLYEGMERADAEAAITKLRLGADPLATRQRVGDDAWAADAKKLVRLLLSARGVADDDLDGWADRMFLDLGDGTWRLQPDPVAYDSMRTDAGVFDLLERIECPALIVPSDLATASNELVAARRRGIARRLDALSASRPNIRVARIAGSDHNTMLSTHVDEVAAAIRAFASGAARRA